MNAPSKIVIRRVLPVLIILLVFFLFYYTEIYKHFSYEQLQKSSLKLQQVVADHPILSPLIFITTYAISICLLLPLSLYFMLMAGFLFPQPWAALYALTGTVISCTTVYWIARTAWGDLIRRKANGFFYRMKLGFQEDATSYLLALRFLPILPFWATNIGPAIFNIPFGTYFWTTVVGLIPSRFIYTQAGRGLGVIFESGEPLSLGLILNSQMKVALICLAVFAVLLVVGRQIQKRWRGRATK